MPGLAGKGHWTLYGGQNSKLFKLCLKPYQCILLVIRIQKMYSLTYLRCFVLELFTKRSNVTFWALQGVKNAKMLRFWRKWSQNDRLANPSQNQNSLYYPGCFVTRVTLENRSRSIKCGYLPIFQCYSGKDTSQIVQTNLILNWFCKTIILRPF